MHPEVFSPGRRGRALRKGFELYSANYHFTLIWLVMSISKFTELLNGRITSESLHWVKKSLKIQVFVETL
jgi:hypothetical protein